MSNNDILDAIKPSDLPSPPQAAIQIMRACSLAEINHSELSRLASSDPILTAELLRVVNSSYFGLSREVQSIPRAITVLGQRTLRNLALCISVRDAVKADAIPGFDTTIFWEDAIRRAVAARLLGETLDLDLDNCFTAGLLQDFGLLVQFFLNPHLAPQWLDMRSQNPQTRYAVEQRLFQTTHDKVGELLTLAWDLPPELSHAIGNHHGNKPKQAEQSIELCRLLYCADWMAAVYTSTDKTHVLEHCQCLINSEFNISAEDIDALLAKIPHSVKEAAQALGLGVEKQQDFEHILRDANIRLAAENLSFQELNWRLKQTLAERDRLQDELNDELALAREIQQSLLPQAMSSDAPISGINLSARQLSGDFFDYFPISEHRVYFNLGDVSGKGINAALLMAKTSSLFRCLGKQIHDPSELLILINQELCETSTRGMFVTLAAGVYDLKTGNVTMVNAGHMPAVLHDKNGKLSILSALGPPLGVVTGCQFPSKQFNLNGGSLYLFSDGVTEGQLASGEELGLDGFYRLIKQTTEKNLLRRLKAIVSQFTVSTKPLRDDLTLLVVEDRRD